jgi:hypothetical protein
MTRRALTDQRSRLIAGALLLAALAASRTIAGGAAPKAPARDGGATISPDLGRIGDPTIWRVTNGEFEVVRDNGRRVLRLAPIGGNRQGSNLALALVIGFEFAEGVIDVDLRGNARGQASFPGVAFAANGQSHEAVYFRPFNFQSADPAQHAHAVQYVAAPDYPWDRLRASHPGVYEAAVAPVPNPEDWFHARIDVSARQVRVSVNHADTPCLVVDRLNTSVSGGVGLWVDSRPGSFSNLKITRRR